MTRRFSPGKGCCGPSCTLFTDDFERADGSPGSNWNGYAGSWAIASGVLTTSSADAGILLTASLANNAHYFRVKFKAPSGAELLLAFDGLDCDTRLRITVGTSGSVKSENFTFPSWYTQAECDVAIAGDVWHTLEIKGWGDISPCDSDVGVAVLIDGVPVLATVSTTTNPIPSGSGPLALTTVGNPGGTVSFDDVLIETGVLFDPGCYRGPHPCWPRNNGLQSMPDEAQVVIAGHPTSALNGTYVLSRSGNCTASTGTPANRPYLIGGLSITVGGSTVDRITLEFISSSIGCTVRATAVTTTGGSAVQFQKAVVGNPSVVPDPTDVCSDTIVLSGPGSSTATVTIPAP